MSCLQRVGKGPSTAKPATVNGWSSARSSSYRWVDNLSTSVPTPLTCGQVDVLATVVLAVKPEHLDLLDVPRRV